MVKKTCTFFEFNLLLNGNVSVHPVTGCYFVSQVIVQKVKEAKKKRRSGLSTNQMFRITISFETRILIK